MSKRVVHLPDDLHELLTSLAYQAGRTPDEVILTAIREHLEDMQDVQAADQVLEAIARGESKTYSLDEVVRQLGLDD